MQGGSGDDTYYVDNAGDRVIELADGGIDLIVTRFSTSLAGTEVENLTLTGTGNLWATGSDVANVLTGNGGSNRIDGGLGADTMIGGLGNDVYYVDNTGDRVIELANGGTDLVYSSVSFSLAGGAVENLTLTGTGDLDGTGNALANVIRGTTGRNVLEGGAGADRLYAGNDSVMDRFVYRAIGDSGNAEATADHLVQFDLARSATYDKSDKIDLSAIDAGQAEGDQAFRFVTEFKAAAAGEAEGQLRSIAMGGHAWVEIDLNGDNQRDMLIVVENSKALTAWDFFL
jgi:Ca2+-binding RTX toxin-like protein